MTQIQKNIAEDSKFYTMAFKNHGERDLRISTQPLVLGEISRKLMSITQYKTKDYLSDKILDIEAASSDDTNNDEGKES